MHGKKVGYYRCIINSHNYNVFLASIFLWKIEMEDTCTCIFLFYSLFANILFYYSYCFILGHIIHTYNIFHDRSLKIEFVKNIFYFPRCEHSIEKNTLILCKMTSRYDRTWERSAKCYRLKIQWSTTARATTTRTATKKKSRPRVTVASNMFHPRPNTLRPIEAKTQSIVSYEGVTSEEGGGSPEKRP